MKIYKYIINLTVVFAFVLVSLSATQAKTIKDTTQKPVMSKYERIISLKPNITQILIKLGVGDKIVGVTKFCPKPNSQAQVVGDYNSVDLEAVMRLKPDLVLISPENSRSRQFHALLASKLNLKLFHFRDYPEMKTSLLAISKLLGFEDKGKNLVQGMDDKLITIRNKNMPDNGVGKLFIVIVQRRPLMVAAGNTYISSLFQMTGLRNAFGQNKIAYPVIDEEELIREVVDYTFDVTHKPESEDKLFLNKRVITLNIQDFLASPQSVDHLVQLFNSI